MPGPSILACPQPAKSALIQLKIDPEPLKYSLFPEEERTD